MKMPSIPDNDADFTPELARKIIAKYQELLALKQDEISILRGQRAWDSGEHEGCGLDSQRAFNNFKDDK